MWLATRPTPPRVVQLTVAMTPATALTISGAGRDLAITPDGSRIVYVGNNGSELFVRSLDALEPVSLYKADRQLRGPFISPDGQWVGFVDNFNTLKKVAITGGPATTVTPLDGVWGGAVWMPDDTIVFARWLLWTEADGVGRRGGEGALASRRRARRGRLRISRGVTGRTRRDFHDFPDYPWRGCGANRVLDLQTHTQTVVVRGGVQGALRGERTSRLCGWRRAPRDRLRSGDADDARNAGPCGH
jgi:hypothetical protein